MPCLHYHKWHADWSLDRNRTGEKFPGRVLTIRNTLPIIQKDSLSIKVLDVQIKYIECDLHERFERNKEKNVGKEESKSQITI